MFETCHTHGQELPQGECNLLEKYLSSIITKFTFKFVLETQFVKNRQLNFFKPHKRFYLAGQIPEANFYLYCS